MQLFTQLPHFDVRIMLLWVALNLTAAEMIFHMSTEPLTASITSDGLN